MFENRMVDRVVCLSTPRMFMGVGGDYREFGQTTNDRVRQLLERANEWTAPRERKTE